MNVLIVVLTIILITSVGLLIIRSFNLLPKKETLLTLGCAYGLGVGVVSAQLALYSFFRIPWEKQAVLFPWLLLVLVIAVLKRNIFILSTPPLRKLQTVDRVLVIFILVTLGYVIFEALLRPVMVWDAWATWVFNAKVFFIDGKIDPQTLGYLHTDYPLIINLLGTFIYIMLGQIDDTSILLTSTAFYIFTGITLFAVLKDKIGFRYALLIVFLFATTQSFIRQGGRIEAGLADLPLGYYFLVCGILLLQYLKTSSAKILILLSIFLAITGQIKVEGVPFTIVTGVIIFIHIYKHKLFHHILPLLFWILPALHWELVKKSLNLGGVYYYSHPIEISLTKIYEAIWGTFRELINVKSWSLLWITYFMSLFFLSFKKYHEVFIVHILILSQLILYILIYMFTYGNSPESSAQRLLTHIAPLAIYVVGINLSLLDFESFFKKSKVKKILGI